MLQKFFRYIRAKQPVEIAANTQNLQASKYYAHFGTVLLDHQQTILIFDGMQLCKFVVF